MIGRGGYRLVEGHSAVLQGRKTCGIRRSLPAPAAAPLRPSKVGYDCGACAPFARSWTFPLAADPPRHPPPRRRAGTARRGSDPRGAGGERGGAGGGGRRRQRQQLRAAVAAGRCRSRRTPRSQIVAATQVSGGPADGRLAHDEWRRDVDAPVGPRACRRRLLARRTGHHLGRRQRRLDRAPRRGHGRRVATPAPASSSRAPPTTARASARRRPRTRPTSRRHVGALPAIRVRGRARGHGSRRRWPAGEPGRRRRCDDVQRRQRAPRRPATRSASTARATPPTASDVHRRRSLAVGRLACEPSHRDRVLQPELTRSSCAGTSPVGFRVSGTPRPPRSCPARRPSAAGGVAIPAAPDIAVGPDGRLHIAYTVINGGHTDVVYAYSNDDGTSWTAPVSVADPGAAAANQFLPAIAVAPTASATIPGGRAEVVYLDSRDGGYRPFLTAFAQFLGDAAPTRGGNRSLDPAVAHRAGRGRRQPPGGAHDPRRGASRPGGPAFAWWPNTNNGTGDPVKLYRSRVNHGAEAPVAAQRHRRHEQERRGRHPRSLRRDRRRRRPGARQHHRRAGAREHPGHHVHPVAGIRRRRRADTARRRRPAARRHAAADRHRQRRPDAGRRQDAAAGPAGRQRVAPAQGDRRGPERPAPLRARAAVAVPARERRGDGERRWHAHRADVEDRAQHIDPRRASAGDRHVAARRRHARGTRAGEDRSAVRPLHA